MKRKELFDYETNNLAELTTRNNKERKLSQTSSSTTCNHKITQLHQDYIKIIFSYLPPIDLLFTIPFVCSFWYHFINNKDKNIENQIWKNYCPKDLLNFIKEDEFTNYKKLVLNYLFFDGDIFHKELFVLKLQNLFNKIKDTILTESESLNIKEIKEWKRMKEMIENTNVNCHNYLSNKEFKNLQNLQNLDEKEKQLKFLKETIYCNPSKLDVSQEEDDDYRYPGRYFIGISFVNKLIIIGYNGNCSNKFIYEGGAGAERYHDFELKETKISLTYQLSKSIHKKEEETSTSKEEEIKEEDTIELFSSEKEGTYGECFKNVDINEALKFFEELRKELGYNELTNKDFIDTLVYKLNDYYKSLDFDNYIDCFCDNFVSVEDFIKEINNDENDDDGDKEEEKELKEEEE
ncbi:hypothetical protein ABK040_016209 [Willaertia magna]